MQHPIEYLLLHKTSAISSFVQHSPDYWELSQKGYDQVSRLLSASAKMPNLNTAEHLCLNLWQLVLQYQFLSLELIVSLYLDSAFALMRNAAELSRDVACINGNIDAQKLWVDARVDGVHTVRGKFQKVFRFNDSIEEHKRVHMFYEFASERGTHSHATALSFSKEINSVSEMMEPVNVSKRGLQDGIAMWIGGFCPMHIMCAKHFVNKSPQSFDSCWKDFLELHEYMEGVFKVLVLDPKRKEYDSVFRKN